jgi:hypothetical protein
MASLSCVAYGFSWLEFERNCWRYCGSDSSTRGARTPNQLETPSFVTHNIDLPSKGIVTLSRNALTVLQYSEIKTLGILFAAEVLKQTKWHVVHQSVLYKNIETETELGFTYKNETGRRFQFVSTFL